MVQLKIVTDTLAILPCRAHATTHRLHGMQIDKNNGEPKVTVLHGCFILVVWKQFGSTATRTETSCGQHKDGVLPLFHNCEIQKCVGTLNV